MGDAELKQASEQPAATPAMRGAVARLAMLLFYVMYTSVGWLLLALLGVIIRLLGGPVDLWVWWFVATILAAITVQIPKFLKRAGADIESAWYLITVAVSWSLLASVFSDGIGFINGYRRALHLEELSPGSKELIMAIPLIDIVLILASLIRARIVGHGNIRQGLADGPVSNLPLVKQLAWQIAGYAVFLKVLGYMMNPDVLSEDLRGRWENLDGLFVLILFAPVAEELFFRGWLWTGLVKRWSAASTIALTSAIWLALHLANGRGWPFWLIPVAYFLARAWYYGESVRAPIALHMIYNFITVVLP